MPRQRLHHLIHRAVAARRDHHIHAGLDGFPGQFVSVPGVLRRTELSGEAALGEPARRRFELVQAEIAADTAGGWVDNDACLRLDARRQASPGARAAPEQRRRQDVVRQAKRWAHRTPRRAPFGDSLTHRPLPTRGPGGPAAQARHKEHVRRGKHSRSLGIPPSEWTPRLFAFALVHSCPRHS